MRLLTKLTGALALGLALATSPANADIFDFSYTFGDGLNVTGSLYGTKNGIYVDNVSNVSVFFGADAMPGTVFTSQFDGASFLTGSIVSFEAPHNNFVFANSDFAGADLSADSIFLMYDASVSPYAPYDTAVAVSTAFTPSYASQDAPIARDSWHLVQVPEQGATAALVGIALCGLGWARRRLAV